jgi:hypothetical protein
MVADKVSLKEYTSGETVEPGHYVDVETGAIVHVHEADELPVGRRVILYRRKFRKIESAAQESAA